MVLTKCYMCDKTLWDCDDYVIIIMRYARQTPGSPVVERPLCQPCTELQLSYLSKCKTKKKRRTAMANLCYICGSVYPDAMRLPVEWKMTLVAQEVVDPNYTPDKLSCCMSCNNRMIFSLERLRNKFQPHTVHLSELQMLEAEKEMGPIVRNVPLNDSEDIISV